jgi:(1->4)-alpha-D-glucan 1-alpha-D-glucosylmutase
LRAAVDEAVLENREGIRATVLGQKLLQLLLPGTADTYQGCEVVNLSLVDPDNRRPVDYDALEDRLARLEKESPISLADEKMLVTSRALRVRRELRECFGDHATYEPLATNPEHAVGFVRSGRVACVVTRAQRRLVDSGGWSDQSVTLPAGTWRDDLTGRVLEGGRDVTCAELFGQLPVALLVAR